ncbi:hypothetical protein EVAR_63208_1 [Eumeta japonica]|uniref:Uncharacterized protein n=1 Tax=Eumeta variegata TaxID=151549 RepID=A0A4C1ZI86_EUMVA|nr:hypothetical protein EVAR_63208_1 [Eumeta japonica]
MCAQKPQLTNEGHLRPQIVAHRNYLEAVPGAGLSITGQERAFTSLRDKLLNNLASSYAIEKDTRTNASAVKWAPIYKLWRQAASTKLNG